MVKKVIDAVIALMAGITAYYLYDEISPGIMRQIFIVVLLGIMLIAVIDFVIPRKVSRKEPLGEYDPYSITELILLDEHDKPIKSWDLMGKTSLLIGKENDKENDKENVDVDLDECEYSALIDHQHALLNYCLDYWYIEDIYSRNGVRVQMINDGICYKVAKDRPCRLNAGDIILIANTKLLIT